MKNIQILTLLVITFNLLGTAFANVNKPVPTQEKPIFGGVPPKPPSSIVDEKDGVPINQVNANRSRNPQAFDILLHYYTQLGLFNINEKGVAKPDISALRRKVTSDTTNSLLDIVTEKQSKGEASSKTSSFIEKLSKINS